MLASPTLANPTCKTQVKYVEKVQKEIVELSKECKKKTAKQQLTCYQFLAINQEALSGAIYYAEAICTKETQILIAKIKRETK